MKKRFILACLAFLLTAACAEEIAFPVFEWERDPLSHWQLDAASTVIRQAPHTPDDEQYCTVCGCEILDWGDGSFDLTDYDAYGNVLRCSSYDTEGLLLYQSVHVLTCTEDGVPLRDAEYMDGMLVCESLYTVNADGEQLPVMQTYWNDDGTTSVNEYDSYGNCIRTAFHEADGSVSFETISEFAQDDYGWYYERKTTSRFSTGESFQTEHNQYGDTVRSRNTDADGTVWSDSVFEYEYQNGMKLHSRQYSFGVLVWEQFFNEYGDIVTEIEYLEDGSTVVYENDADVYEPEEVSDAEDPDAAALLLKLFEGLADLIQSLPVTEDN